MTIKPRNRFRNKAVEWLYKVIYRLENECNFEFAENGEGHFLEMLVKDHRGQSVTIFDVGANKGEYAALASQSAERNNVKLVVHAFEPLVSYQGPGTFNRVAVSETDGFATIYKRNDADGLSSMHRMPWLDGKFGRAEEVKVPTIRLDTYIKEKKITHIDLLKIDVEGHELSVLMGGGDYLRPDFISHIQFEYGTAGADGKRLWFFYKLLQARGYKMFKLFPKHVEAAPYARHFETAPYMNLVAMPLGDDDRRGYVIPGSRSA